MGALRTPTKRPRPNRSGGCYSCTHTDLSCDRYIGVQFYPKGSTSPQVEPLRISKGDFQIESLVQTVQSQLDSTLR